MKVYVFVEGPSDATALEALWSIWREALRAKGHGMKIISLENKNKFLQKIGAHAAEKLCANSEDIVVALPDLYPSAPYENTQYKHDDFDQLRNVMKKEVSAALIQGFQQDANKAGLLMERFLPAVLKHDLEMLLLAAKEELRSYLRTSERLGAWRNPVEDQNHEYPPKRIVENLFRTKSVKKRAYRATADAPAILRKVKDIKLAILYDENRRLQCPLFKDVLDWIGGKTKVPAYS